MKTYLATDNRYYKIGKSENPNRRIESMKTGNPYIKLIGIIDGDIEKMLHKKYNHKKVIREWFDLSKNDLDEIYQYFNKYEDKKVLPKNKNTLKDIKLRIKSLVHTLNSSMVIENKKFLLSNINNRGFYKIQVLEDSNFIVLANNSTEALTFLNKIGLETDYIISCNLIDTNNEEISVEYLYQNNTFINCYLHEIEDSLKDGIVCDDFVSFGFCLERVPVSNLVL